MASTIKVFKGGIELGSGSASAASASITSYTATNSRRTGTGRNVQVLITQAGTNVGRSWNTRVVNDGGSTLTLADNCPFVGA